tara:strand:+ start:566 stop:919 length:354 start_codon:yes stop_codon:yes gene_type:complete
MSKINLISKQFLILVLVIPTLSFASEWKMESLMETFESCTKDDKESFEILSNGEILEYCACSTKMIANLLTESDIVDLYERNLLGKTIIELNEKYKINVICTEKLFYEEIILNEIFD